jgi:hypothetical protein
MAQHFWTWYGAGVAVMFVVQLVSTLIMQRMDLLKIGRAHVVSNTYLCFATAAAKSVFWPAQIVYEMNQYLIARSNHAELREMFDVDLSENQWGLPEGEEWAEVMQKAFFRAQDALVNSPGGIVHPMVYSEVLITLGYANLRQFLLDKGKDEKFATEWYQAQVVRVIKNVKLAAAFEAASQEGAGERLKKIESEPRDPPLASGP